jgi:uncharacterized phage infection (PIP) family protein YhgE
MLESLITTLDKFTPEILVILSGLLVITTTLFLWLWFANRRTYNLLRHQLPASVVKTYLDSVIQNSTSLKSALFRGGGNDIGVMPTSMPVIGGGESMAAAGPGDAGLRDQVQRLQSEISSLQSQLATANNVKKDLEGALATAHARIKELEALLAKAGTSTGGGDSAAVTAELQKVSKERDELREKLKEYEIIEDDLANLKRLQQENQQLKRSLGVSGGSAPVAAAPAEESGGSDPLAGVADLFEEVAAPVASDDEATAELEEFLSETSESPIDSEKDVEKALNDSAPKAAANEKTPEDLLSEFEKMLG